VEKGRGRSDGAAVEIEGRVSARDANACGNVSPFCKPSIPRQTCNFLM
jgi:hypothetical protein